MIKISGSKKKITKEEFYSLIDCVKRTIEIDYVLEDFNPDYKVLPEFTNIFFDFLKNRHYITTAQRLLISKQLKNKSKKEEYKTIEGFMSIMVLDYDADYVEFATINNLEFEAILCEFFEEYQDFGKSLLEDIKNDPDVNWEYLFKIAPEIDYLNPPIQNTECFIDLKDVETLKTSVEALEELIETDDKIVMNIINTIKTIVDKIS